MVRDRTPSEALARLTKRQRITLDVMGTEHPVGVPFQDLRPLVTAQLVTPRSSGFVLSAWGVEVRNAGRGQ